MAPTDRVLWDISPARYAAAFILASPTVAGPLASIREHPTWEAREMALAESRANLERTSGGMHTGDTTPGETESTQPDIFI